MSLPTALTFARRELRGGLRGFRIFLACLALGVAAIAAVGTVRSSIEAGLAREGAALLGGDAEMEFTYRFATQEERDWMRANALAVSEVVDFRSMAVVGDDGTAERALTQVKAVDDAYPLVGTVQLDPEMPLAQALAGQDGVPGAVMERVLADRLGLRPGDGFRLGTQNFVLSAILAREPDNASAGFGLGPRTIVATPALDGSGLISPGSLFSTDYRLDLPPGADLSATAAQARARFQETGMRWRDARDGAPGVRRFVDQLGAFLVLVGLSGLAVGGVGVSAAVRAYLAGKTGVIATLRTLGADRATIFQTYFLQIGALSLVGIVLGLVLGAGIPVLLGPLLEAQLPVPAVFAIYPRPLVESAIYGFLTAFIFTLWPLARTEEVRGRGPCRGAGSARARRVPDPPPRPARRLRRAGATGPALGALRCLRHARRRRLGRAVSRARPVGSCRRRTDRRQHPPRDLGRVARRGSLLLLRRHPEGSDGGVHRAGAGRPRSVAHGQRADAAGGHHPHQRPPRAGGGRGALGRSGRPGHHLCRCAARAHPDHGRDMVGRGL